MRVPLDPGFLELQPGAVVLINRAGDGEITSVRNLWEPDSGKVLFRHGDRRVVLSAGEELLVSATKDFKNPDDNIGRRRLHRLNISAAVVHSEFSISSLLQSSKLLREIRLSKNKEDQVLESKIKKMAVILSIVTASHGPYSSQYDH